MTDTKCDCTVDCDGQHHEINYCLVHGAGPVLLEALEGLVERLPNRYDMCRVCGRKSGHSVTCDMANARAAIDQAKGEA